MENGGSSCGLLAVLHHPIIKYLTPALQSRWDGLLTDDGTTIFNMPPGAATVVMTVLRQLQLYE